jgi:hypothetical protein
LRCEAFDKESGKLVFTGDHEVRNVAGNQKVLDQMTGRPAYPTVEGNAKL